MKYEAVLFDMDGTTQNTVEDLKDSANAVLRKFGFPETDAVRAKANLGNGSKYYLQHSAPAGTDEKTIDEMLKVYKPYYDTHCNIKTRPYDGIPELMAKLRAAGLKLLIISNKPDSAVRELAKQHFNGLPAVGESSGVPRKPNPDMVYAAAEKLGLRLDKCVYVGDTEVDIMTAANAGTDCICVSWGFRTREQLVRAGADRIADSTDELYEMITGE